MELLSHSSPKFDLIIVGGGAAGFMAAITAAENSSLSILILEANSKTLDKVRISGGGRCNVTNACWDPKDLSLNYPRGSKNILNSFRRFASGDAVAWFAEKGVNLIEEEDGRMFPSSNSSSEIIVCLRNSAKSFGVKLQTNSKVKSINYLSENNFLIHCGNGSSYHSTSILLATGSNPTGRQIASELGHQIVPPVPSLFSFQLTSSVITSCAGFALSNVDLKLITSKNVFHERGRILITHWGFSGPAILRLSAFAARDLAFDNYKSKLIVSWLNNDSLVINNILKDCRIKYGNKTLLGFRPFPEITKKLWLVLLSQSGINHSKRWADFTSIDQNKLNHSLCSSVYCIKNRRPYKDEFVTAGGIPLDEVDFSTMESRKIKGLFFAGELLDIDGLTGGFNFQHCWTSGWIAGLSISNKLPSSS